ncbi:MAG TPA: flagellar basal body rod protein FlgC [Steroidobacteraceae bacterium]|nr:flagellar basal body rod protein FlgC [Steroidobacteraceae bacterium]
MDMFGVFDISSAGMSVEQTRLATAASNLANARTTKMADGTLYQPLSVVVRSSGVRTGSYADVEATMRAGALPRPYVSSVAQIPTAPRLVYDPGHPDADAKGFVSMPGVDTLSTMMDLISVSRGYEANLRAFDITRHLIQKTIDMGRNR